MEFWNRVNNLTFALLHYQLKIPSMESLIDNGLKPPCFSTLLKMPYWLQLISNKTYEVHTSYGESTSFDGFIMSEVCLLCHYCHCSRWRHNQPPAPHHSWPHGHISLQYFSTQSLLKASTTQKRRESALNLTTSFPPSTLLENNENHKEENGRQQHWTLLETQITSLVLTFQERPPSSTLWSEKRRLI